MSEGTDSSPCPSPAPSAPFPLTTTAFDEELARLAKAIAHPARIAILRILKTRRTCVCGEIVEELPLAQSTVSQHLKVLKEAGLIRGHIEGPRVCYCVEPAKLDRMKLLFHDL